MHLGHSQGRSFFFEPHLLLHPKEVGQQTEGHVVVPAGPAAHLVGAHAQVLLALLKTGFNRPATGREAHQFSQRAVGRGVAEESLQDPGAGVAAQQQPDVGARQTLAHGHHPQGRAGHTRVSCGTSAQ